MKIKICFMFMLLFLMTGCTVTYDMYIGDKITDNIFLHEENEIIENLDYYNMYIGTDYNINNYAYHVSLFEKDFDYPREEYSGTEFSGYIYNYTYKYNKMAEKSMIYDCYDEINVNKNNYVTIETSDEFKCFEKYSLLDEVIVNIYYSGDLIETNADVYEDGVYTWYINRENSNDKKIFLNMKKIKRSYSFDIIGGIILGILILISLVVIFNHKKKKIS